uniref:Uncharacterized protein n=1 Tax=Oryza punctata TaxID=4537 RepID=A0A0E0LJZ0_ORYPU
MPLVGDHELSKMGPASQELHGYYMERLRVVNTNLLKCYTLLSWQKAQTNRIQVGFLDKTQVNEITLQNTLESLSTMPRTASTPHHRTSVPPPTAGPPHSLPREPPPPPRSARILPPSRDGPAMTHHRTAGLARHCRDSSPHASPFGRSPARDFPRWSRRSYFFPIRRARRRGRPLPPPPRTPPLPTPVSRSSPATAGAVVFPIYRSRPQPELTSAPIAGETKILLVIVPKWSKV